jgi:hypothetical protein
MQSSPLLNLALLLVMVPIASGCSLLTIESPVNPLSDRDVNARLASHRFVEHFSNQVRTTADRIAAEAEDESLGLAALRWKIGAPAAIAVAAFQTSPRDALIDSWVYSAQMTAFFRDGAGHELFGPHQAAVIETSSTLEADVAQLALGFLPAMTSGSYATFVSEYTAGAPLTGLLAPRESSIRAFYASAGIDELEAIGTVGTLGQVLSDFGSRASILGERFPQETAWRTELFMREQGVDRSSLQRELALFGHRVERVAAVAEQAPVLIDDGLARLQEEIAVLIDAIGEQREAAMESLGSERAILVDAFSRERVATIEELERYVDSLVADTVAQVPKLAGVVLFGLTALVAVLFGLPFGIGVALGRLMARRPRAA